AKGESPVYCNFRLFRFAETELKRLESFLRKLNNNEIVYCLYYSVYCFNNNVLAISQSGNVAQEWNNRIALNNAVATNILVMDFDDISEDEFLIERVKLANLGIETIDVFTGHGFQSIILLDKITEDKDILRKFTNLLILKGFSVDKKIKDSARIMRLPYTFNSKDLTKTVENPSIIKTFIYADTDKRYSLEDVFSRIETLETVIDTQEELKKENKSIKNKEHPKVEQPNLKIVGAKDTLEDLSYNIDKLKLLYPMLNIEELPKPVLIMLEGFRQGYANSMLIFLVTYLKEQGYSKSVITDAMLVLCELNRFNYAWHKTIVKSETDRFYYSNYNWRGIFSDDLQAFGYVEYNLVDKSVITINNYVFNNLYKISSSAFYIYLKLLLKQDMTRQNAFTIDEMCEVVRYKRRAILKHLDDLVTSGLINKKRANRRNGEEYKYYLSVFITEDFGFTKINKGSIKLLLNMVDFKQLNQTQLAICMYFKHICYGGKSESNISQESIAKALGVNRTTITKAFKDIEDTELIHREKEDCINDFKFRYNYSIHY
ncbi:hypothetical protein, partial [Paraclostridium sordellii]|uniref:hypothetical protein n=1 Tax=Paraclostridium sordellii TaxID=1505 RepID=UPI000A88C2F7